MAVCSFLHTKKCTSCQGGVPPLSKEQSQELLKQIEPGWRINKKGRLEKEYTFPNFLKSMEFANEITPIAEEEAHHPDFHVSWGKCRVEIWTHKINGLTENDFILASKIDRRASL